MRKIERSTRFKKGFKRCKRRGKDLDLLKEIVVQLQSGAKLNEKHNDHSLKGDRRGNRECHIEPDWLLEYRIEGDTLYLIDTGSHADLFNM